MRTGNWELSDQFPESGHFPRISHFPFPLANSLYYNSLA